MSSSLLTKRGLIYLNLVFFYFLIGKSLQAQYNSIYKVKVQEYDSLFTLNTKLLKDTVNIYNELKKIRSANDKSIKTIDLLKNKKKEYTSNIENKKSNLAILKDSLSAWGKKNSLLREQVRIDSIAKEISFKTKRKLDEQMKDSIALIQNLRDIHVNAGTLEVEVRSLQEYRFKKEALLSELRTSSQKLFQVEQDISLVNAALREAGGNISKIETERQLYTFFNASKAEIIKRNKAEIIALAECYDPENNELKKYKSEIVTLISTGIIDKELINLRNNINNGEKTYLTIKNSMELLERPYDDEKIRNTLNLLNGGKCEFGDIPKREKLLREYCMKNEYALYYIDKARNLSLADRTSYLNVVLEYRPEFDDYPFLKNELIRFRDNKVHNIPNVKCTLKK